MPYGNIKLDVGAAINAFKRFWNYAFFYKQLHIWG